MITTGHHTCSNEGGKEVIILNAPFKSIKKHSYVPYLGDGYYYWDNNIEVAKRWGVTHYNNSYTIIASKLNLVGESFFDLVGNRTHMLELIDHAKKMKPANAKGKNWTLGILIQCLRRLNSNPEYKGIFPYKVIRAVDLWGNYPQQTTFKFVEGKDSHTNLAPKLLICLIEKNDIILNSEIVYLN